MSRGTGNPSPSFNVCFYKQGYECKADMHRHPVVLQLGIMVLQ